MCLAMFQVLQIQQLPYAFHLASLEADLIDHIKRVLMLGWVWSRGEPRQIKVGSGYLFFGFFIEWARWACCVCLSRGDHLFSKATNFTYCLFQVLLTTITLPLAIFGLKMVVTSQPLPAPGCFSNPCGFPTLASL